MNFQIIDYDEGALLIDREALANIDLDGIQIALDSKLRHRDDDDYIGTAITILYFHKGKKLVEFPVTLTIYAEGWTEFMAKNPSIEEIQKATLPAWIETIGFDRALCALKLKDTPLAQAIIPMIDYESFVKKAKVTKDPTLPIQV